MQQRQRECEPLCFSLTELLILNSVGNKIMTAKANKESKMFITNQFLQDHLQVAESQDNFEPMNVYN